MIYGGCDMRLEMAVFPMANCKADVRTMQQVAASALALMRPRNPLQTAARLQKPPSSCMFMTCRRP